MPACRTDRGATAVEYGLIMGMIAIVVVSAVSLLGSRMSGMLTAAGCAVAGVSGSNESCAATASPAPGLSLTSPTRGTAYWVGATAWPTTNMIVSGVLTLGGTTSGNRGYGLVVRGSGLTATALRSGYTFQVDPGLGGFVLRGWSNGGEFQVGSTVPVPSGFNANSPQQVQVSVVDNTLVAAVGGVTVMQVADLRAATATGKGAAGFVMPTGTQYGCAWYGSTVTGPEVTIR
jgi:pilus assembly protein Flp/PilA